MDGIRVNNFTLEGKDVKEFLTHIALRERVSASTQNQAFDLFYYPSAYNNIPVVKYNSLTWGNCSLGLFKFNFKTL